MRGSEHHTDTHTQMPPLPPSLSLSLSLSLRSRFTQLFFAEKGEESNTVNILERDIDDGEIVETYQMISWKMRATQNQASMRTPTPLERSGDIGPGPSLLGATPLAIIVPMDPITWAASKVKQT